MTYRDDLDAAQQRISLLERLLAEKEGGADDRAALLTERDALAKRVAELAGLAAEKDALAVEKQELAVELAAATKRERQAREEKEAAERALKEARARARAEEAVSGPPKRGLVPVDEHNRLYPPLAQPGARRSGLLCPRCRAAGDEVEMVLGANQWRDRGVGDVQCPRCLLHDWMRMFPRPGG